MKKDNGVTLIEPMIVIAIIGILSGGIITAFLSGTRIYRAGIEEITLLRTARNVVHTLEFDLLHAEGIVDVYKSYERSNDTLILRMPTINKERYIVYCLDDGELRRISFAGEDESSKVISVHLREMSLSCKEPGLICFDLHFSYGKKKYDVSSAVRLRNYEED